MNKEHINVISCSGISKCFRIYDNPKARLKQALWRSNKKYYREFWALKDIDFSVKKGESFGIIGRNGSGKSTLLQLICGTLTPTEGIITTKGKIAALLELGSGFNPEFTGLENIYLNSSLLGLSKDETEDQLDDILAFADIGDFIFQPVRTYSSGMSVRLAFAIIAHVNADILVVDEALAVGDAYFTQKCMRFINRFREDGSLVFVSHDPGAVSALCDKALLLEKGKKKIISDPKNVLDEYTKSIYSSSQEVEINKQKTAKLPAARNLMNEKKNIWIDYRTEKLEHDFANIRQKLYSFKDNLLAAESYGTGEATLQSVALIETITQKPIVLCNGGESVTLKINVLANKNIEYPAIGFVVKNSKGLILFGENTLNSLENISGIRSECPITTGDIFVAEFEFTMPLLPADNYSFTVSVAEGSQHDHKVLQWANDALLFESSQTLISAGLAGIPMHMISLRIVTNNK